MGFKGKLDFDGLIPQVGKAEQMGVPYILHRQIHMKRLCPVYADAENLCHRVAFIVLQRILFAVKHKVNTVSHGI